MSTFIRRYAKYLNEKAVSYRTVAFDFCKCKRGKEDGILRQMNTEQLLKTLPALQAQLDSLLEFDCAANELCNGVVNSCFMLLFRDLIRLFACYNDGIINLLEKYFDMNKKHAREALDIYKKFLIRMDRVAEFLKVAESVGIDKGDIPDLTKAPSSLLEALEQHLATLEGRKGSASAATTAASAGDATSPKQEVNGIKVDESVRKAVEEEAEIMNKLKFDNDSPLLWEQPAWEDSERRLKEMSYGNDVLSPPSGSVKTNPFLSSPEPPDTGSTPTSNQKILDLFNTPIATDKTPTEHIPPASDDLLCLNNNLSSNPFADSLFGGPQKSQSQPDQNSFDAFTNGFGSSSDAFASDASFAAAFGDTTNTGFDAFGDTLQPQGSSVKSTPTEKPSSSFLKGDLDSTLASLASNLDINGPKQALKKPTGHQWGSPKPPVKTAGPAGWTAPAAVVPVAPGTMQPNVGWTSSPQHGFQQMAPNAPQPAGQWGGVMGGAFPQGNAMPGVYPQQPYMGGNVRPPMGTPAVGGMPMASMSMPMATTAAPQPVYGGGYMPQVPIVPSASPGLQTQTASVNDPFGAL